MEIVLFSIEILVLLVLIVQSIMLYKVYRKENPKLDTNSKEWIDFKNLFKDRKIHNGYVVSYYNEMKQFMLRFSAFGFSSGYALKQFLLEEIWFHCDGLCKSNYSDYYDDEDYNYEDGNEIEEVAAYNLDTKDIVSITPIEEYYGQYGDNSNEYCVTCTLKNGTKVQIIFEYKENGNDI